MGIFNSGFRTYPAQCIVKIEKGIEVFKNNDPLVWEGIGCKAFSG